MNWVGVGAIQHDHTGGQNQGAPKICQARGVVWLCGQELRPIKARARTRQPLGHRGLRPTEAPPLPWKLEGHSERRGGAACERPLSRARPGAHLASSVSPHRLRKNLKSLIIVHPSWFIRTVLAISRPFIR